MSVGHVGAMAIAKFNGLSEFLFGHNDVETIIIDAMASRKESREALTLENMFQSQVLIGNEWDKHDKVAISKILPRRKIVLIRNRNRK
jgi:hypothetical protein